MPQLIRYKSFEDLKSQSDNVVLSNNQRKEAFIDYENMLNYFKQHIVNRGNQTNTKAKKLTKSDE